MVNNHPFFNVGVFGESELPLNLSGHIYLMATSGRTCLFLRLSEGTVANRTAATCRGAIIRTLAAAGIKGKPEGKLRRGEGRCKNTPTSTEKEQKREEKCSSLKAGRCQNRRRSSSGFVNSHLAAERLPVETSVSAAKAKRRRDAPARTCTRPVLSTLL